MKPDDLPYRSCVGIMVINKDGLVWCGRRISPPNSEYDQPQYKWQMPQGGIDKGEDPEPAALRELYEETGIKSVTLLAQTKEWLTYDLPKDKLGVGLKGKFRGQKQKWFAYRFEGDNNEIAINPPPDGHKAEFDAWDWKPMQDLPDLIIPFKRDVYVQVINEFSALV